MAQNRGLTAVRIIYNSYGPIPQHNRPWKPWQMALIELLAMAIVGFVVVYNI